MEEEMDPSSVDTQHTRSLTERDYFGLSYCSSVDNSTILTLPKVEKSNHNMKGTELRLGLPGSQSPEREPGLCLRSPRTLDEKPLFPLVSPKERVCRLLTKGVVSGNKRGFSDTADEFSEVKGSMDVETNWMLNRSAESPQSVRQGSNPCKAGISVTIPSRTRVSQPAAKKDVPENFIKDPSVLKTRTCQAGGLKNNNVAPAAKAQVVGWPPIRSHRKNTLATTSKNIEEVDGKPNLGPLFMKVSMDGAPYLRKIDLKTYSSYQELSSALEKMFSCFILRQCGSHGTISREMLSEIKLKDPLHDSEYVLTYEDKDGDWMLVGDVPWGFDY